MNHTINSSTVASQGSAVHGDDDDGGGGGDDDDDDDDDDDAAAAADDDCGDDDDDDGVLLCRFVFVSVWFIIVHFLVSVLIGVIHMVGKN